jgi:hypothetical protein
MKNRKETMKTETKAFKRPYRKPRLEQVRLVAEEAVLMSCKSTTSTGPHGFGTFCRNPGGHWCPVQGT